MHYFFEVAIPPNTAKNNPYVQRLGLTKAVITDVLFYMPNGHAGLAYLRLLYHDHQLYPLNPDGAYRGDELPIPFKEYQPITIAPYELKAQGWNLDDTYTHRFLIGFGMLRPEEIGQEIPAVSQTALLDLIGQDIGGD